MENKDILEKAIQKAIDGGWKQPWVYIHGNVKDKKAEFLKRVIIEDDWLIHGFDDYVAKEEFIFNHNFAKALWGEEKPEEAGDYYYSGPDTNWEWHLQQMVIAENPLEYLEKNI